MAVRARSLWPQRTTFWAGLCFMAAFVLQALVAARFAIAVTATFTIFIPDPVAADLAAALEAAGFIVAAAGVRGEVGVAADSLLGRVALILFGARDLVFVLLALVLADPSGPVGPVVAGAGTGVAVLTALAGAVAAVIVYRVAVLGGVARWILLPIAVVHLALLALQFGPFLDVLSALAALPLEYLQPVLLLALGAAYLLHGRGEAVKHRARVIDENW